MLVALDQLAAVAAHGTGPNRDGQGWAIVIAPSARAPVSHGVEAPSRKPLAVCDWLCAPEQYARPAAGALLAHGVG